MASIFPGDAEVGNAFAEAYLEGDGGHDPDHEARLGAHLALGRVRRAGTDLLAVAEPASPPGPERGSVMVLVVTDDRPFLVDTVTSRLTEAGWTVRQVWHPILPVKRDAAGRLLGWDIEGLPESWLSVEAYPPLGTSAQERTPAMLDAVGEGLEATRAVEEDAEALGGAVRSVAARVGLSPASQQVPETSPQEVAELLAWLAEGHFEFFGYRHRRVQGGEWVADPAGGLGILRGATDGFAARGLGRDDQALLVVTRDERRSPLHRSAFLDHVAVREFDASGQIVGEHQFVGLRTLLALTEPLSGIPVLGRRADRIRALLGHDHEGHSGQMVEQALATFPRELLFEGDIALLAHEVDQIAGVQEKRTTRLFLRRSPYGHFWTAMVFLPRDRYRTAVRERIESLLMARLGGDSLDFQAAVTESPMARLTFMVHVDVRARTRVVQADEVEREVVAATRVWEDEFNDAAVPLPAQERGVEFGEAYIEAHTPRQAVADLLLANQLSDDDDLRFALYKPDAADDPADLRFKVITRKRMSLSRVMPHLDALGVTVIDERPFHWQLRGEPVSVFDFGFLLPAGQTLDDWTLDDRARFAEAFAASYQGRAHAGRLNRLVMSAGLTWVEITWLRTIARYLRQAGIPFSQQYVADALTAHPDVAAALVAAFRIRFDPTGGAPLAQRASSFEAALAAIDADLQHVESLDQDRIVRMFVAVLRATVRTNAFAADQRAIALKIAPADLDLLPQPRPAHEIFVAGPQVEGVHLRFGAVARGGLRWSDRPEDFRTEVLGLVKAQMVKNTVIVPVGAKGGFVPLHLPDPRADRAAWLAQGQSAYRCFIEALLSVTDDLVGGVVTPPAGVVRHDGDDTYLVVAADKGTASFSDLANSIALERGFWLGDAFASGGSVGYDHKRMGITARGAWESVKRHFYEIGVDCQRDDFTCVGIGDMAGDVFGNGMLRSPHTRLVAAFNHQHIFLDPEPDAATSFGERRRLFDLPRSTWADYDPALISPGGGVFERAAKSVPISPQVAAALGLDPAVTELSPPDLIAAILRAPVDLLWNGGIGTYVKAADESHAQVGDKTNDAVRVDGAQVRAKVAGEGGNLGWTQRGRIEFARAGGRINTDFIDNSAGVDTSDHEVNIKILLQPAVAEGRLDAPARAELLASMTDEVAALVLAHNVDQNIALSVEQAQKASITAAYETWMQQLEAAAGLDRELEGLPSAEEMERRISAGIALTRPELASLLAWTKIHLERLMIDSPLPDDPYLANRLTLYFPKALREVYAADMVAHPLRREIVTTVAVNRFVNSQGISAFSRLAGETSSDLTEVVRAQLAARTIFAVGAWEQKLAGLDLPAAVELRVRVALQQMIERGTRWLLHHRRGDLDIRHEEAAFTDPVAEVLGIFVVHATARQREAMERQSGQLSAAGVPTDVAEVTSRALWAHQALPIVDLSRTLERPLDLVTAVYFALSGELGLDVVFDRVNALERSDRWDTMARAALRDDLQSLQAELTRAALQAAPGASAASDVVTAWRGAVGGVEREVGQLAEITAGEPSLARMQVALRTIRTLLV